MPLGAEGAGAVIDRVHHVGVVLPDADRALGFFRDLMGLTVTVDRVVEEQGVRGVLLALGENEIELLQPVQEDTGVARYLASRGPTLHHICFNTDDIAAELARLKGQGVDLIDETSRDGLAGKVAFIHPKAMHGVLIELAQPPAGAHVSTEKGFDHVVARVADGAAAARTWHEVIGLSVAHELHSERTGATIRQLPSGQCNIELLSPAGPDSPFAQRIEEEGEGAMSMVAIEVADLDAEVARYRGAGLELPDPAPSPLPGGRASTISAEQAFGLGIQLIEFSG